MPRVFQAKERQWKEVFPGVYASDQQRYVGGGGAAVFQMEAGAVMPEHPHATGEHVYIIEGCGEFGELRLEAGDGLWVAPGERHEVRAISRLTFFATSLPRIEQPA